MPRQPLKEREQATDKQHNLRAALDGIYLANGFPPDYQGGDHRRHQGCTDYGHQRGSMVEKLVDDCDPYRPAERSGYITHYVVAETGHLMGVPNQLCGTPGTENSVGRPSVQRALLRSRHGHPDDVEKDSDYDENEQYQQGGEQGGKFLQGRLGN
jgi:hypothetical protein